MRIDLFVAPGCPGCPAAREVIESFARTTPGVQVREWDLSSDPGPAVPPGSPEQKATREVETVFDSSYKPPLPNDLDRNIRRVRAVFSSEDSETRT